MIANGNNSPRVYMSLHSDTHYPDSEAASLCSFSLTLRALHYKSLFMCLLPKDCESAKSWPCVVQCILYCYVIYCHLCRQQGRIQGGVGHRSTQKFEKIRFFGVRSLFFHTKYPKMVCASLRSAQFFKVRPPLTWNRGSAPGQYMCIRWETDQKCSPKTLIGTVIVSVLATSAVDRGFESRSGQTMFCTHILPSSTFCWKFMI